MGFFDTIGKYIIDLEKALGGDDIPPYGSRPHYVSGELNNSRLQRPNKGTNIDGGRLGAGYVAISNMIKERTNPNFIDNFFGSWKGIVLRVEPPSLSAQGSNLKAILGLATLPLPRIKVRIPEMDGFLPDPLNYGNNGDSVYIDLHRTFEAANTELREPSPGDIVTVNITDLDNMDSAGVYTDVIFHSSVGGGAVGKNKKDGSDAFVKGNKLNAGGATGDSIGGTGPGGPSNQTPGVLQEKLAKLWPVAGIEPPITGRLKHMRVVFRWER